MGAGGKLRAGRQTEGVAGMSKREIRGRNLSGTKAQYKTAIYLLLDQALPHIKCELIEKRGNYLCDRCDDCMLEQLLRRAKDGEKPRKVREAERKEAELEASLRAGC
jgi:hypothetical protein